MHTPSSREQWRSLSRKEGELNDDGGRILEWSKRISFCRTPCSAGLRLALEWTNGQAQQVLD